MGLTRNYVTDTAEKDTVLAVFTDEDGLLRNVTVRDAGLKRQLVAAQQSLAKATQDAADATAQRLAAAQDTIAAVATGLAGEAAPAPAPVITVDAVPVDPMAQAQTDAVHASVFDAAEAMLSGEAAERQRIADEDAQAQAAWDAGAPARAALRAQQIADAQKAADAALTAKIESVVQAIVPSLVPSVAVSSTPPTP